MRTFALIALCWILAGCASTPDLDRDVFPDSIRAQCVKAKAQAIALYGPPVYRYWHVTLHPGTRIGNQWAFRTKDGRLCGGATRGAYTQIGCGPNGEINYEDLVHEGGEYVTNGKMQH